MPSEAHVSAVKELRSDTRFSAEDAAFWGLAPVN